jgi:hypothetical protein
MKETHPFLELGKVPNSTKLILGSFPVYSITIPDSEEKLKIRKSEGTVQFFYGSCHSSFWGLYHLYIDNKLNVPITPIDAIKSLSENKIAISDIIFKCKRNGRSAADSDLTDREYNVEQITEYLSNGINKVLCTSKGVMDMFHDQIAKKSEEYVFQEYESHKWQSEVITKLKGSEIQIKKLICRQYVFNRKTIRLISIPSPGSWQRQLKQFGFNGSNSLSYANRYFEYAFKWLNQNK